jgi:hypothetical protein
LIGIANTNRKLDAVSECGCAIKQTKTQSRQKNISLIKKTTMTCRYEPSGIISKDNTFVSGLRSNNISGCQARLKDIEANNVTVNELLKAFEIADRFNVKYYGAVGDGVAQDRAAIQEAIEAAVLNGGGVVYFPPGTYLVDGSVILRSGVVLQGSGISTSTLYGTIIRAGGDFPVVRTDPAITVATSLVSSGVRDMTLYGFGKDNLNSHGLYLDWCNRVYVSFVRCHACRHGFDVRNQFKVWFMDCTVDGAGADQSYIGFFTDEMSTAVSPNNNALNIDNCNFYFTENTGIKMLSTMGTLITSTECGGNGLHGLHIGPTTAATGQFTQFIHIVNCLFDSVPGWGILWEQGTSPVSSTGNGAFSNTWIGNCGLGGMRLQGVENLSVTGSIIQSVGSGVQLEDCQHLNFTGLNLKDYDRFAAGANGFEPINSTDILLSNYVVDAPAAVGVPYSEFGTTARVRISNGQLGLVAAIGNNNTTVNNFNVVTSNPFGTFSPVQQFQFASTTDSNNFFVSGASLATDSWRQVYTSVMDTIDNTSTAIIVDNISARMDATAGNVAVTLANGNIPGQMKILIRGDGSANTCVVTANINGLTTATFPPASAFSSLTLVWDSTTWVAIGNIGTVVIA